MFGEQRPGLDRLQLSPRGQVGVLPAGEHSGRVPLALSMPQHDQAVGKAIRPHGAPETADLGHNLMTRIRKIRGVVAVRDELSYPPAERSIAGLYF